MERPIYEFISEREFAALAKRVMALSAEQIDDLGARVGWMDADREQNKSLPTWKIEQMKEDLEYAEEVIENLILDTPGSEWEVKEELLKHLYMIEKGK